jgi:LacI family transcriptional regulator
MLLSAVSAFTKGRYGHGDGGVAGLPKNAATIYEVARHAGVSIATVSRVNSGDGPVSTTTRARVVQAIEELDYRPHPSARSLAAQRHDAHGIVFPDLSGPYYSAVIHGFEGKAVEDRKSVLILGTHGRDAADDLVQDLAARCDGLVIMGRTVSDRVVERLSRHGLPIVLLARPPVPGADTVRSENRSTAADIVRHLFDHGHDDLLFVGDPASSPDAAERWAGFEDAWREGRGEPAPAPIVSGFTEAGGYAAVMGLLAGGRRMPSALMCANDEIAIGAIRAIRERGIDVPDHIAITGWDDIPVASIVAPGLTTVRQPMRELGAAAAALLEERISGSRTEPRHVLLPTSLVVRTSCGCTPNGGEIS